jgi:hypothetical protein
LELLLNLCWLLLIAPAFCFWVRKTDRAKPWHLAVALACLLVVLFPVISATDDLRAVGQEMEESAPCKGTRASSHLSPNNDSSLFSVLVVAAEQLKLSLETCGLVPPLKASPATSEGTGNCTYRGPPSSLLA